MLIPYRSLWIIYTNYAFYVCTPVRRRGACFLTPINFDSLVDAELWIDEMADACVWRRN